MSQKVIDNFEEAEFLHKHSWGTKLHKPIINSTLRYKDQIEHLQKKEHKLNTNDIAVCNKPKLTARLNFGVHQKIFGDLTPININDCLLLPKAKLSFPKKYLQSNNINPTPDLHDFLDAVESLTYVIKEPQTKLELIEYNFDVLLAYKLFASNE